MITIQEDKTFAEWFERRLEDAHKIPEVMMYGEMLHFAGEICIQMHKYGITEKQVIDGAGISKSTFNRILNCEKNISLLTLTKVFVFLNMELQISFIDKNEPDKKDE